MARPWAAAPPVTRSSSLELLGHRREQGRNQPGGPARGGAGEHRVHRVALLGQGRRPALGLAHLPHLGLGEEDDVERDLAERPRRGPQGGGELGDPDPVGVPGQQRLGEPELGGEAPGHLEAGVAERRQRPRGAAELHRETLVAHPLEAGPGRVDGDHPPRRAQAEGGRQRLLEQGARRHRRVPVGLGEGGAAVAGGAEVGGDQLERAPGDEHERAVDDVLAGRSPVEVRSRARGEPRLEGGDERHHRVAGGQRAAADVVDVETRVPAGGGDLGGRGGGHHSCARAGGGEGRLHLEHGAQPGAVGHHRVDRRRAEERADQPLGVGRRAAALRARGRRSHRRPAGGCRSAARPPRGPPPGWRGRPGRGSSAAPGRRRWPPPRRGSRSG